MKKISLLSLISLFALIFSFQSCGGGGGDDGSVTPVEDKIPPVIDSYYTPAEGAEFTIGNSTIVVSANVSDNVALKSYTIEIHNNFNNHTTHTKAFEASSNNLRSIEYVPFTASRSGNLSGKTDAIKESIEVGDFNAEGKRYKDGKYHLVITVTDAAGNKAQSYRNIVLN